MTTYVAMNRMLQLILLLSCCFSFRKNVVLASTNLKLDFSYLHRVKSTMLGDAIRQNLMSLLDEEAKEDNIDVGVDIDVSASMIGKDLKDLLVSSLEGSYPAPVSIQLTARANQWTMDEAAVLLQSIVETTSGSSEKQEPAEDEQIGTSLLPIVESSVQTDTEIEVNETAIESNETVIDSNETVIDSNEKLVDSNNTTIISMDDNQTATVTTTTEEDSASFNISIQSLDLGWKNFGQGSSSKSRRSKAFLKSLQKLIESKTCPQTLRFPVCGLGPGACRAIGKVRYQLSRYTTTTSCIVT
jgi:hypothetical protein